MVTKAGRIARAKELINQQPKAGRRLIAKTLRQELGQGLRDATILSLQRAVYPERRQIRITPYLFAKPQEHRYKPVRQSRYNKLVKKDFTSEEARRLSTLPLSSLTFLKQMIKSRKELIASLDKEKAFNNWSDTRYKEELKKLIDYTYKDQGWADLNDNNNPYSMVRAFRRAAIEAGEWNPKDSPWRRKPSVRRKMNSPRWKGNTKAQHKHWRELHKEEIRQAKHDYRQRAKARAK